MKLEKKKVTNVNGQVVNTTIWNIEIDYNNLEDLESLGNKIKSQINQLRSEKFGSKKEIQGKRFDSCAKIHDTDISDLYLDLNLDKNPIYYVYAHCLNNKIVIGKDGVTSWLATVGVENMPFYIGKGTGNRAYDTTRNETHRKVKQKLKAFDQDIKVQIVKDGLTELEALCLESKLIDVLGVLGKGGRLVNLDEGVKSQQRQDRYFDSLCEIHNFYKGIKQYKKPNL